MSKFNSEKVFLAATQPAKSIFSYLQTSSGGLSKEQIQERRAKYGKNEIEREKRRNPFLSFIKTFINPFIGDRKSVV